MYRTGTALRGLPTKRSLFNGYSKEIALEQTSTADHLPGEVDVSESGEFQRRNRLPMEEKFGEPGEDRTLGRWIKSPLLYH